MKVRCRICGQEITLNEDGAAARDAKTDPYQQLKSHNKTHLFKVMALVTKGGIANFLDTLLFECQSNPEAWAKHQQNLFDYVRSKEALNG